MDGRATWMDLATKLEREIDWSQADRDIAAKLAEKCGKAHWGGTCGEGDYECNPDGVTLDKLEPHEQRLPWLAAVKRMRAAVEDCRDLAQRASAQAPAQLPGIERRLAMHLQAAYGNFVEVGRCLIEAKESGEIPHGQWEQWVQQHTGMSERQAQKLMKVAREVPADSAMARLDISKIQMVLALPEPEREAMAERAADEGMTVKQLKEAIERERRRSDQMIAKYNAANDSLRLAREDAERRFDMGVDVGMTKQRKRQDDLIKNAEIHGYARGQAEAEQRAAKQTAELGAAMQQRDRYAAQVVELQSQLRQLQQEPGQISELEIELQRAREEAQAAQDYARQQAQLRKQAQDELINLQVHGGSVPDMPGVLDYATGITSFLAGCGAMPCMDVEILALPDIQRRQLAGMVEQVAEWVQGMRKALALREVAAD